MPHPDLLTDLQARRETLINFCADLVRAPSPNPPGDTRAPLALVHNLLTEFGLPVETVSDQPHTPNLISSVMTAPAPHLILVGHADTYPEGDARLWRLPPYSGALENGRLHGRGVGDMKSGLTALLFAYLTLARTRDFTGRLTFLAVSDEMNFSPHGARLLADQRPDLFTDPRHTAVIDAEPTSPDFVLFGEKGMLWIEVTCIGPGGSSAFSSHRPSAIERMQTVLAEITRFRDWSVTLPPAIAATLAANGGTNGFDPSALTYVSDAVLSLPTVNVGLISGGRKINLIADECRAEVDIRLPPGLTLDQVTAYLDTIFAAHRDYASYRVIQSSAPNWSPPDDPLFKLILTNAQAVLGFTPRLEIGITASDTRLFRARGIPAALLGPRIANQGAPDESIAVDDLLHCAQIFALTAQDFLS